MDQGSRRGLSGKARRAKYRKRAAQLHAQVLLEEYYEPDSQGVRSQRSIPIRGRSEFLPAVAGGSQTIVHRAGTGMKDSQLNLPLEKHARTKTSSDRAGEDRRSSAAQRVAASAPDRSQIKEESAKDAAICFSKPRGPTYDLFNLRHFDAPRRRRIRLGGFLAGCAMGTGFALGLLFLLRWVTG